eukprot:TRINITY_DN8714_c0_g1_i1.p2 TRINITY_DN8714_c0_g1~~TRINITY_DN8714_c0_g1_i1.p2  ORF type:complete len:292 (-),score=59.88 TRINITY_DN8714_c0_g1_i1:3061-3936(-)
MARHLKRRAGDNGGNSTADEDEEAPMPSSWLASIREAFQEENRETKAAVLDMKRMHADLAKDVSSFKLETKQEMGNLHQPLLDLETKRTPGLSSASTTSSLSWSPSYVEIKKFCSFQERGTKGLTRVQAMSLVELLKGKLDDNVVKKIKDVQLRGVRSYSVRVNMSSDICQEVCNSWRKFLADGIAAQIDVECDLTEAKVIMEPSPHRRTLNGVFGKSLSLVRHICEQKNLGEVAASWDPDFVINFKKDGRDTRAVTLDPYEVSLEWSMDFLNVSGFTVPQLNARCQFLTA